MSKGAAHADQSARTTLVLDHVARAALDGQQTFFRQHGEDRYPALAQFRGNERVGK